MTAPQAMPADAGFDVLRTYADPMAPPKVKKQFTDYDKAARYVAKRARPDRWVIQLAFALDEEPTP